MDTQPYFVENNWVKNADTGNPVVRVDTLPNGEKILVIRSIGAITVKNAKQIIEQIEQQVGFSAILGDSVFQKEILLPGAENLNQALEMAADKLTEVEVEDCHFPYVFEILYNGKVIWDSFSVGGVHHVPLIPHHLPKQGDENVC